MPKKSLVAMALALVLFMGFPQAVFSDDSDEDTGISVTDLMDTNWFMHVLVSGDAPDESPRWIWSGLQCSKLSEEAIYFYTTSKDPVAYDPEPYTPAYLVPSEFNDDGTFKTAPEENALLNPYSFGVVGPDEKFIVFAGSDVTENRIFFKGNALGLMIRRDADCATYSGTTTEDGLDSGTTLLDYRLKEYDDDYFVGWTVTITSGECAGQTFPVTGFSVTSDYLEAGTLKNGYGTLTVATGFSSQILAGVTYVLEPYAQADLEGSWYGVEVVSGDAASGDEPRVSYGWLDIGSDGTATGVWTVVSGAGTYTTTYDDTFVMKANGLIARANSTDLTATMSDDKTLIVMNDTQSYGSVLRVLSKRTDADFSLSDLEDSWFTYGIVTGDAASGAVPRWEYGTTAISSAGAYSMTVTESSADAFTGVQRTGVFSMDAQGIVTGSNGMLHGDGNLMFLVKADSETLGYAFTVYVRDTFVSSDDEDEDEDEEEDSTDEETDTTKTLDTSGSGGCFIKSLLC